MLMIFMDGWPESGYSLRIHYVCANRGKAKNNETGQPVCMAIYMLETKPIGSLDSFLNKQALSDLLNVDVFI